MSLFRKVAHRSRRAFFPSEHDRQLKSSYADGGNERFRYDYDLNSNSLVMDLGGYKGQWASDIFSMYCCSVIVFQAVPEFAQSIQERFKKNSKMSVLPFGAAKNSRTAMISVCEDGSSVFRTSGRRQEIEIVDFADRIRHNNISSIDLVKVHIEGGEYELLERPLETDLIRIIRDLQVQFHEIAADSGARMEEIHEQLSHTHNLTYQYRFVWENWTLK